MLTILDGGDLYNLVNNGNFTCFGKNGQGLEQTMAQTAKGQRNEQENGPMTFQAWDMSNH